MKRKINAIWKGDGIDGQGVLTAQSGAMNNMSYSFKTRNLRTLLLLLVVMF